MKSDLNSNTRTLIVSFVIAIMFLIPLRFIEVGNMLNSVPMVLGDSTSSEIILPKDDVVTAPVLEAPYQKLEESKVLDCLTSDEVQNKIDEYTKVLDVVKGNDLQTREVVNSILEVQKNICR